MGINLEKSMSKEVVCAVFRSLVGVRRLDYTRTSSFVDGLITGKRDKLSDLPKLFYDFVHAQGFGDEIAFAFALIHDLTISGGTAFLVIIDGGGNKGLHHAVAFAENGYARYAWPGRALQQRITGPYMDMSQTALWDEAELGAPGRLLILDPYGQYGNLYYYENYRFIGPETKVDYIVVSHSHKAS